MHTAVFTHLLAELEVLRGPNRKRGTPVSGWRQRLVSRTGVSDHTSCGHDHAIRPCSHRASMCGTVQGGSIYLGGVLIGRVDGQAVAVVTDARPKR